MNKQRVLFLCTGNSCRSQMAEGLLRAMAGERFEVASAGTAPASAVSRLAVRAMAEIGIDISAGVPRSVDDLPDLDFDYVITVCDNANADCPYLPGDFVRLHWPFDDPAAAKGSDEERMAVCRRVRDGIRKKLEEWLASKATEGRQAQAMTQREVTVELLYKPGCRNFEPTRANVLTALAELGMRSEIREVIVDSLARAQELGSPGSTTVRINGVDMQPATADGIGMG